jgi:hypothetical protein
MRFYFAFLRHSISFSQQMAEIHCFHSFVPLPSNRFNQEGIAVVADDGAKQIIEQPPPHTPPI